MQQSHWNLPYYVGGLAWIAGLNRDALRDHRRLDLVLELRYASEARIRVLEMVRGEQECCAFLRFDVVDSAVDVVVTITAPERARDVADVMFEQFISKSLGTEYLRPASCGSGASCCCCR